MGNVKQNRLCSPHLPQHERMGLSVETGYIFSLQLLTKVSDLAFYSLVCFGL